MNGKALRLAVGELWWMGIIKSTAAIFFGTVTVFWPEITLTVLIYLLSAFTIVFGLVEAMHGMMSIKRRNTWWVSLIIGLLTLGVGVYLAQNPLASLETFILVVGISFIAWGLLELVQTFISRVSTDYRVLSLLSGLSALAAGVIVLMQPIEGSLAFVWVIGLFGIVYGILGLSAGIALREDFEELTAKIKK